MKAMSKTRPYFLKFDGVDHMVEATSKSAAIAHLAHPKVNEVRVARSAEVSAWVRGGGEIPMAGEYPEKEEGLLPLKGDGAAEAEEHRSHDSSSAVND